MKSVAFAILAVALVANSPRSAVAAPSNVTYAKVPAVTLPATAHPVAAADLNGDGFDDLIAGASNARIDLGIAVGDPVPPPLPVYFPLSNGDGTFRGGTAEIVIGDLPRTVGLPVPVFADFNNDGRLDVAIFDQGIPAGGLRVAGPPLLYLSGPDGKLHSSGALADAAAVINQKYPQYGQYAGRNLHVYKAAVGDINHDGNVDIWVESCGGMNACSHFMMNNGDGTFAADDTRVDYEALHGPPGPGFIWRQFAAALVDVDGEGSLDLVVGQLKGPHPEQDAARSYVFLNDGGGRFPTTQRIGLPEPDFGGWPDVRGQPGGRGYQWRRVARFVACTQPRRNPGALYRARRPDPDQS